MRNVRWKDYNMQAILWLLLLKGGWTQLHSWYFIRATCFKHYTTSLHHVLLTAAFRALYSLSPAEGEPIKSIPLLMLSQFTLMVADGLNALTPVFHIRNTNYEIGFSFTTQGYVVGGCIELWLALAAWDIPTVHLEFCTSPVTYRANISIHVKFELAYSLSGIEHCLPILRVKLHVTQEICNQLVWSCLFVF